MAKSALRVLQIMEYIAEQRDGCTHTQLAHGLNIPKSSLTALLNDLHSQGYLQRDPASGKFTIGVQVLSLANSYLRNLNLARLGAPVVGELYAAVRQFSVLAIPIGTEYVVICTESVPSLFTHTLQLGYRGPLFCSATGRAILAYLPEDRVNEILLASPLRALTPFTKTDPAAIKAEFPKIRRAGIAYGLEENIAGITGIAAPVFDRSGTPIAAVGVAAPSAQLNPEQLPAIEVAIKKAAGKLSEQLGFQGHRDVALLAV
jgi:DNA-binding IclR family transcriptional regulator